MKSDASSSFSRTRMTLCFSPICQRSLDQLSLRKVRNSRQVSRHAQIVLGIVVERKEEEERVGRWIIGEEVEEGLRGKVRILM